MRSTWSALVLAAALSARADAQCMQDNLDSAPCCTPVAATLPAAFPQTQQPCRFICFKDCTTQLMPQLCVTFSAPNPALINNVPVCGVYTINVQIRTCAGQLLWSGPAVRAHYSRNWLETDPNSVTRSVWRFLLNGDIRPTSALPTGINVRPPCTGQFGWAYFSGYIDYAQDCSSLHWSAAWVLSHECDFATHGTGSSRPIGSSHPNRSYVFVGPSAGFVVSPGSGAVAAGSRAAEAMRTNVWTTAPNICRTEEALIPSTVNPVNAFCECAPSLSSAPLQYNQTELQAFGACGVGVWDTGSPPMGPIPFVQKRIGGWTNPLVFPGQTELLVAFGTVTHNDSCGVPGVPFSTQHVEGVVTINNGSTVSTDYNANPLGTTFLDLGSSQRPNGTTILGVPHVTWFLLNLNL